MRILYDHQIFMNQRFGGISRYFTALVQGIANSQFAEPILPFYYARNHYLANLPAGMRRRGLPQRQFRGKARLERVLERHLVVQPCVRALKQGRYCLVHPTYYDPYFLDHVGDKPVVLTVHDLISERYADTLWKQIKDPQAAWKRQVIPRADRIIAVSECTKRDLISFYGIRSEIIDVVYHATDLHRISPKAFAAPRRFILFVGQRWGYKNFDAFAEAVRSLLGANLALVCAGGDEFNASELELFENLGISKNVWQVSVEDAELAFLYRNAALFVFPSFYEGFGIPILEALACGCPAAVSHGSSFSEVGSDAVAYFDPKSPQSIEACVRSLLDDETRRKELRARGLRRAQSFSWELCVKQTLAAYEKTLS